MPGVRGGDQQLHEHQDFQHRQGNNMNPRSTHAFTTKEIALLVAGLATGQAGSVPAWQGAVGDGAVELAEDGAFTIDTGRGQTFKVTVTED